MSLRGSRNQRLIYPGTIRNNELRFLERCGQTIDATVAKLKTFDIQLLKEHEFFIDFPRVIEFVPSSLRFVRQICINPVKRLRKLERSIAAVPIPAGPEHVRQKVIDVIKSMMQELKVMLVGYADLKKSMEQMLRGNTGIIRS
uniref:Dynamin n=1 Tax=Panagrolaimus sp. JU765 TaxID=591449 RepID=A0AC34QVR2_9BILA